MSGSPLYTYYDSKMEWGKAVSVEFLEMRNRSVRGKIFFLMPKDFTEKEWEAAAKEFTQKAQKEEWSLQFFPDRFDPGLTSAKRGWSLSFVADTKTRTDAETIMEALEILGIIKDRADWRLLPLPQQAPPQPGSPRRSR